MLLLEGHDECINSVCFSPDGTKIVTGSEDKLAIIWDAKTGAKIGSPLKGHSESIKSVCFSPNGMLIATGSEDN